MGIWCQNDVRSMRRCRPKVNRYSRKRGLPRVRHYPLTRGFGFLGLPRRQTIDYFSYLLLKKIVVSTMKFPLVFFTMTLFDGKQTQNVIRRFALRCISDVCKHLTSLVVSRVSCPSPWARQNISAL